jgi:hypothetical protein
LKQLASALCDSLRHAVSSRFLVSAMRLHELCASLCAGEGPTLDHHELQQEESQIMSSISRDVSYDLVEAHRVQRLRDAELMESSGFSVSELHSRGVTIDQLKDTTPHTEARVRALFSVFGHIKLVHFHGEHGASVYYYREDELQDLRERCPPFRRPSPQQVGSGPATAVFFDPDKTTLPDLHPRSGDDGIVSLTLELAPFQAVVDSFQCLRSDSMIQLMTRIQREIGIHVVDLK